MKKGACRGYSLIEVLVSLVILAVIMLPLVSLFHQGTSSTYSAGRNTRGAARGQEMMEELKARGFLSLAQQVSPPGSPYVLPREEWLEEDDFTLHYRLERVSRWVHCSQGVGSIPVDLILVEVYIQWTGPPQGELVLSSYLSRR